MFLVRISRRKTCEFTVFSRNFLSYSKNIHVAKKNEKYFLKYPCCLTSNFEHFKLFKFSFSTECSETIIASDGSDFKKDSLNTSSSFYVQHPDVTKRSEKEIEDFRKSKNITVRGVNVPRPITQFSELCLPENLTNVLYEENYPEPTPIQSQGWPVALSCRDMVGVSQTGSGKTLAYMLPAVIHALHFNSGRRNKERPIPSPKVLVLGPTRELVQQILQVSRRYIEVSHLKGACVYGGASRIPQLRQLQGAEICVATPGRLLDYLDNRELSLKNCTYLVLDEADRMLDMGFEPQIRDIIDGIPNNRQTLMWSATWPREIRSLAEDFLTDYVHITVGDTELVANPNIEQNIYIVDEDEKFEKFISLLTGILENEQSKVLVFAETKRKVDHLTGLLKKKRFVAWGIHGDCTQNQRDRVLKDFRVTKPSVLIATDIASRGLDITDINHVVNYDFPLNIEDYVHRIGRTARGSACGQSHSFLTPQNSGIVKDLISVLQKAKQSVNPELHSLAKASNKFYKPQRRYGGYDKPYGRTRMYRRM